MTTTTMRPNQLPKFQTNPLTPEKQKYLVLSFQECENLKERDLKCPHCNAPIQGVFSDAQGHFRVKCNKCKANMILNIAYFRTQKGYGKHKKLTLIRKIRCSRNDR